MRCSGEPPRPDSWRGQALTRDPSLPPSAGARSHPAGRWLIAWLAVLSTACGQWSGRPASSGGDEPIALGPGPTLTVIETGHPLGGLAMASWRSSVVLAWWEEPAGQRLVRLATSTDAGATFGAPVTAAVLPDDAAGNPTLHVTVTAATGPGVPDVVVWVSSEGPDRRPLAYRGRIGSTEFRAADASVEFAVALPETWQPEDAPDHAQDTWSLHPPAALRAAGTWQVPRPSGALGPPAIVVDDHGALALAWREGADEARRLVIRRAWIDWNAADGRALPFDAAYELASLGPLASAPVLARVPGGVVVAWTDERRPHGRALFVRRLGLDMSCTLEGARLSGS